MQLFVTDRYKNLGQPDERKKTDVLITGVLKQMEAVDEDIRAKKHALYNNVPWRKGVETTLVDLEGMYKKSKGMSPEIVDEMKRQHRDDYDPEWITTLRDKAIVTLKATNAVPQAGIYQRPERKPENTTRPGRGADASQRGRGTGTGRGRGRYGTTLESVRDKKLSELTPEERKALKLPLNF